MAPRRRFLRRGALAAGCLAILACASWGLTYTSLFHAKVVIVEGTKRVGQREVMRIAQISPGVDVFHLDAGQAEGRLEQDPWIARATVTRRLPSTIFIVVTERTPVALVRDPAGGVELVAADGVSLAPATGREAIPLIHGPDISAIPGDAARRTGAGTADSMSGPLRSQAQSIQVGADGNIIVVLRSGVVASYGGPAQLQAKGQALEAVLAWAVERGKQIVSVNVAVPTAPTATLSSGGVASP